MIAIAPEEILDSQTRLAARVERRLCTEPTKARFPRDFRSRDSQCKDQPRITTTAAIFVTRLSSHTTSERSR
jgi:hypothetical protein